MNPKTKEYKISRCVVCGFPFSDKHHIYPKRHGGKETITLCPNHHRLANIIQNILEVPDLRQPKRAEEFAEKYADEAFRTKVLQWLIGDYLSSAVDALDKEIYGDCLY